MWDGINSINLCEVRTRGEMRPCLGLRGSCKSDLSFYRTKGYRQYAYKKKKGFTV